MKDEAKVMAEIWTEMDESHQTRVIDTDRYYQKMYSSPYTEDQKKEIESQNLDSKIYINLIGYIVESLVGQAYTGKSGLTAIGNPRDAFMWQVVLTGALQKMGFLNTYRKLQIDKHVGGLGILYTDKDDSETNPYGVRTVALDPRKCRWTLNSNDPLWSDLDRFAYMTTMSVKQAIVRSGLKYDKKMFQEYVDSVCNLPESMGSSWSLQNIYANKSREENRLVPWIETFEKEYVGYLKLLRYNEDKTKIISHYDIESTDGTVEDTLMAYFTEHKISTEDALEYINDTKKYGSLEELKLEKVVKRISIGGLFVGKFSLPSKHYPMVPFWYNMLDGQPYGVIQKIEGTANAANNTMLMMLISGWKACGTTIIDYGSNETEELARKFSGINNIIPMNALKLDNGGALEPRVLEFTPLSDAFNRLLGGLINIAQLSTNVNDIMQGMYEGKTPPAAGTAGILQESGSKTFKPYQDADQLSMAQYGRVMVDFIREYSKKDQMTRIMLSDPALLENITAMGMAQEVNQPSHNIEMPINKTVEINGESIVVNDLKNGDTDIDFVVVAGYASESQKRAWLDMMMNTMQQAPQTYTKLIGPALSIMEYPQANKISKELDNQAILESQVNEYKQQLDKKDKELNLFMQQNFRSKVSEEVAKVKAQLSAMVSDMEAKKKMADAGTIPQEEVVANVDEAMKQLDKMTQEQTNEQFIQTNTPSGTPEGM